MMRRREGERETGKQRGGYVASGGRRTGGFVGLSRGPSYEDKLPIPKTSVGFRREQKPAHRFAMVEYVAPTPPFSFLLLLGRR